MSPQHLDEAPGRRSVQGAVRRARLRRRRWVFAAGAVAGLAVVVVVALAVLRGPASVLPGWVDRALDLPQSTDPSTTAAPADVPDAAAVRSAIVGAGPASVVVRAFDGRQLAKGNVSAGTGGCDFDLVGESRRFVQTGGRLYATPVAGGGWTELTAVPAAGVGADRLAQLGLSDVTPYALAADPCRMLAVAATAGVVAESPQQGSLVMTLPGSAFPGRDVVAATARRLLAGGSTAMTVELDVDAAHRPIRIRAFSGGIFDCEAQFQGWGKGATVSAPSGASAAPAAG